MMKYHLFEALSFTLSFYPEYLNNINTVSGMCFRMSVQQIIGNLYTAEMKEVST